MQMQMMRGKILMNLYLTQRTIHTTLEFHLQMENECLTNQCFSYVHKFYYKVQINMLMIQFIFDMPKTSCKTMCNACMYFITLVG